MQTRNKVEQNMDFCGVMSCTNKAVYKGKKLSCIHYSLTITEINIRRQIL